MRGKHTEPENPWMSCRLRFALVSAESKVDFPTMCSCQRCCWTSFLLHFTAVLLCFFPRFKPSLDPACLFSVAVFHARAKVCLQFWQWLYYNVITECKTANYLWCTWMSNFFQNRTFTLLLNDGNIIIASDCLFKNRFNCSPQDTLYCARGKRILQRNIARSWNMAWHLQIHVRNGNCSQNKWKISSDMNLVKINCHESS